LHASGILLPNGETTETTWYHFSIPLAAYTDAFGDVPSFDSCNFMRLFLKGFSDPVLLRFASLDLMRFKIDPVHFDIDVFPNPTDTRLKVEFDEIVREKFEISLTNMLGRVSLEETLKLQFSIGFNIDVSSLEPGFYILRVSTTNFTVTKKVYVL
jgi:hypothetical protein